MVKQLFLSDLHTVKKVIIRDFHIGNVYSALDFLASNELNNSESEKLTSIIMTEYSKCQKEYDLRESLYGSFTEDSEYKSIVQVRRLLPQLGKELQENNLVKARNVCREIVEQVQEWTDLVAEFAERQGVSARYLADA